MQHNTLEQGVVRQRREVEARSEAKCTAEEERQPLYTDPHCYSRTTAPYTTASHMARRGTPQYHPCIPYYPTPARATPATRTLVPSLWQAVDDSSRDEEIWAAALGDEVSPTGPVRKARRMSGAERRKHSKQANITHVTHHGYV